MVPVNSAEWTGEESPADEDRGPSREAKRRPRRLDGLTALRAIAAMAVIFFHANARMPEGFGLSRYLPFVDHYYLGVDLFFILSGFILAHVHGAEFAKVTPRRAGNFYILRLARIYPVHVAMLACYLVLFFSFDLVGRQLGVAHRYTAETFLGQLFLVLPGAIAWNFPAWSVSAEWLAYLAFPLIAFSFWRLSARYCFVSLLVITVGFAAVYGWAFGGTMDHVGIVRVAFEFTAGYLLYRSAFAAPLATLLPVLAATLLVAATLFGTRFGDFGAVLAIGGLVVLAARARAGTVAALPRPLLWLGEISYSLYMVQSLPLAGFGRFVASLRAPAPMTTALTAVVVLVLIDIVAAALLYRFVERPARNWLRDCLKRWARPTLARFEAIGIRG